MPSMYYQNNCSAEELIEFADELNYVQTNSVISFSTRKKKILKILVLHLLYI